MKRDMDLLRDILLAIESNPDMDGKTEFYSAESLGLAARHPANEVAYHVALGINEGLIDGNIDSATEIPAVRSLTWPGHEFLDNIRNDRLWNRTKQRVGNIAGSVSLSVFIAAAEYEAKKILGLIK